MTAQRLSRQIDGLDSLKELAELIKNPEAIVEAQELVREQLALTDAEQAKSDEARKYIKDYDVLIDDIKAREQALAAAKSDYDTEKNSFLADYIAKTDGLKQWEVSLKQKDADQLDVEKRQAKERTQLDNDKAAMDKTYKEALENIRESAAINEKDRQDNENEKARLADIARNLKAKAASFREQVADI